jgi:hypothetical protein
MIDHIITKPTQIVSVDLGAYDIGRDNKVQTTNPNWTMDADVSMQ